jgi:threonine-phosphate decarboxylase
MIDGHGNNIYNPANSVISDFSSNVAPCQPNLKILDHLTSKLNAISNYPEPYAQNLRKMLANKHGLEPSQVLITNGSTEAFYLIASAFSRKKSLVLTPSFSEYEGACKVYNHKIDFLPVQQFAQSLNCRRIWFGWEIPTILTVQFHLSIL